MIQKTKREAQQQGEFLRNRMKRPNNWKVNVWENQGWYFELKKKAGYLRVHQYGPTSFGTSLGIDSLDDGGTPMYLSTEQVTFADPEEGVAAQLKVLRDHIFQLTKVYQAVAEE